MTREEAINVINNADLSKVEDRVIKAIFYLCTNKALEQEPCDDCISRDNAIRVAEQGQIQGYEWQFKKLCNLPSVTPQPKIGKWIEHEHNGIGYLTCSECLWWFLEAHLSRNNYCPNCGTKMQEIENENEV